MTEQIIVSGQRVRIGAINCGDALIESLKGQEGAISGWLPDGFVVNLDCGVSVKCDRMSLHILPETAKAPAVQPPLDWKKIAPLAAIITERKRAVEELHNIGWWLRNEGLVEDDDQNQTDVGRAVRVLGGKVERLKLIAQRAADADDARRTALRDQCVATMMAAAYADRKMRGPAWPKVTAADVAHFAEHAALAVYPKEPEAAKAESAASTKKAQSPT